MFQERGIFLEVSFYSLVSWCLGGKKFSGRPWTSLFQSHPNAVGIRPLDAVGVKV
jgi:hypothetical protein